MSWVIDKVFLETGARHSCQMPARRKAHNANLMGIDMPFCCMFAHELDGALGILKRADGFIYHDPVVWQPVFQHKGCNAPSLQGLRHIVSFVFDRQDAVSAARADDD